MKKILTFLFLSSIMYPQEVGVYQYDDKGEEYLIFGYEEEKKIIPKLSPKTVSKEGSLVKKHTTARNFKLKKEDFDRDVERFLLRLIKEDRKEEFIRLMREDANRELLLKKMTIVGVFKYPLHQAILNKSYKILDLMLSYGKLDTMFVEESGKTTWDIFNIVDYKHDVAMNRLYKKYKLKFKKREK